MPLMPRTLEPAPAPGPDLAEGSVATSTLPAAPPAAKGTFDREGPRPVGRPRFFSTAWFAFIHLTALGVIWVGASWTAVLVCVGLYFVRMFAIVAGYHRHFSHRSYETSRVFRFLIGLVGTTAIQKGPLWWASVHRHHHRFSDLPEDAHSPLQRGFWFAHIGWILVPDFDKVDWDRIRDLSKYPEIRLLDRIHWLAPILLTFGTFFFGEWLASAHPSLGTSGLQLLVWGMGISTTLVYHGSWSVNSLLHLWGGRRFKTSDTSRNNALVALYTLGEGWHNNHHRYMNSERQGFYWWQIDIAHMMLRTLSFVGLVWDLKVPPRAILDEGRAS